MLKVRKKRQKNVLVVGNGQRTLAVLDEREHRTERNFKTPLVAEKRYTSQRHAIELTFKFGPPNNEHVLHSYIYVSTSCRSTSQFKISQERRLLNPILTGDNSALIYALS